MLTHSVQLLDEFKLRQVFNMLEGAECVDQIECFRVVLREVDDFNVDSIRMLVSDFEPESLVFLEIGLVRITKCFLDNVDTDVA